MSFSPIHLRSTQNSEIGHFTFLVWRRRKGMFERVKRTCTVIVFALSSLCFVTCDAAFFSSGVGGDEGTQTGGEKRNVYFSERQHKRRKMTNAKIGRDRRLLAMCRSLFDTGKRGLNAQISLDPFTPTISLSIIHCL